MKRVMMRLYALLAMLFVFSVLAALPAFADYYGTVNSFINDDRWKNGTWWGGSQQPKMPGNSDYWGCAAYACDYARFVWGTDTYNLWGWTDFWSESEIQDGDVVQIRSWNDGEGDWDTHFYVVLDVRDDGTFLTAEGNSGGYVNISDSRYSRWNTHPYYAEFAYGFHNPYYEPYTQPTPVDLTGAKQAYIMFAGDYDTVLAVNPANNNVQLERKADTATQLWSFELQSDGSYIITSLYNGKVLDVDNAGTANGTNVQVYQRWPDVNYAQRWYAYVGKSGQYYVPMLAADKRLDVDNASTSPGTNVHIWQANGTIAQYFSPLYCNDIVLPTSLSIGSVDIELRPGDTAELGWVFTPNGVSGSRRELRWESSDESVATVDADGVVRAVGDGTATVTAVSVFNPSLRASHSVTVRWALDKPEITALEISGKSVFLEWTASTGARSYEFLVYSRDNPTDQILSGYTAETSFDFDLSKTGEYTFKLRAADKGNDRYSDYCSGSFVLLDGDWLYSDTLPENLPDCELQYNSHSERRAVASPGEGWTMAPDSVVTTYQNVGGIQEFHTEQQASDTLVYVGSYYYHYCGPNSSDANYEYTSLYTDYHNAGDVNQFYVTSVWNDSVDPSYLVYAINWIGGQWADGPAYCPALKTNAFYRRWQYQPRVAETSYLWLKDSGWTDAPDPEADSVTYRFRTKGYELSFDTDGGSEIDVQLVLTGQRAVKPDAPKKDGFWFIDWYTDKAFSAAFDFNTEITRKTVLYAKWAKPDFFLPASLTEIGEEAFTEGAFTFAVLPDRTEAISRLAFADCANLTYIYIPNAACRIDRYAFTDVDGLTIIGKTGSTAESFAKARGFRFVAAE